jgi:hypothetical protein
MKLLVISQYFYPEQFSVSDVCFKLASLGHDITILTGLPNYPTGEIFDGYQWEHIKHGEAYLPGLNACEEKINGVRVMRTRLKIQRCF